ncbi:NUDIX hydrolase [Streptococcus gallolyticus]|nr:NUDIX hydrolase [Streptococcus gallolyticus]MBY5040385.1 NUDIX hydrolase [Streptococcus gallolyticus]
MVERWNAFDKDGQLVENRILDRADWPTEDEIYHLAVNVWVQHEDGDWLFVRRSPKKSHFPLYYEAGAGGSVLLGEASQEAALRELQEETGLKASTVDFLFRFTEEQHRTHFDVYLAKITGKKDVSYQISETDAHVWVAEKKVPNFLETHQVFTNQKEQILAYLATK